MPEIHIRPATTDDVDVLCRLYYELHEYHVASVPDRLLSLGAYDERDWTDLVTALERLIGDDSAALLVAGPALCWSLLGIDGLLRDGVPLVIATVVCLYGLWASRHEPRGQAPAR